MAGLTVTHRLAILGGVGLLSTGVAVAGTLVVAQSASNARARLAANATAANLARALDTRASELKVDGYKALLMPSPKDEYAELDDDAGKVTARLDELAALPLSSRDRAAVAPLGAAFTDYVAGIRAVIDQAVADQAVARTRFEDIQAANDVTDEAVGTAIDRLDAEASRLAASVDTTAARLRVLVLMTGFAGLVAVVACTLLIRRGILRRLAGFQTVLAAAAEGDLTGRADQDGDDELARMGAALNRAMETVSAVLATVADAGRRLTGEADRVRDVAHRATGAATEASAQADDVSTTAATVTSHIQTVASGSQEMGASISEIARNAQEAVTVATGAVGTVETTTRTMNQLGESSREIGDVVRLITSIAEQTNLLALNATIEAARAGDAGKGFAVVADEVKQLAQETARATEDISRRVEAIQGDSERAEEAIGEIAAVISRITEFQTTIASAVEEQTATTDAMNAGVGDAAQGSVRIAASIDGLAAAAAATASTMTETLSSAESITALSQELGRAVAGFRFRN